MYYLIVRDGPLDNATDIQGPYKTLTAAKRGATVDADRIFTIITLDNRGLARHCSRAVLPPAKVDWK